MLENRTYQENEESQIYVKVPLQELIALQRNNELMQELVAKVSRIERYRKKRAQSRINPNVIQ